MTEFYFRPSPGECVQTAITLEQQRCSALSGTVLDSQGRGVKDACAVLCGSSGEVLAMDFTGEDGRFYFAPLEPEQLYRVRVFRSGVKLRELEIVTD